MKVTYGIVGVQNATVTTYSDASDVVNAQSVSTASGKDYDKVLQSITFNRARKRWAEQGAEEVRYFPC